MNVKRRTFTLQVKEAPKADGRFTGYVSIFGTPDSYREIVARGAFKVSLAQTAAAGRKIPICWQHDMSEPIGHWDVLQEDEKGLYGEGELWIAEAPYARIAQRGMGSGAISGLSIGYFVTADSYNEAERIRTLTAVELIEASVVTNPAHDDARVDTIKAKLAAGETLTEREFGKILRERGFSRSDADVIANVGFKAWSRRETANPKANDSGLSDLIQAVGGCTLPQI